MRFSGQKAELLTAIKKSDKYSSKYLVKIQGL